MEDNENKEVPTSPYKVNIGDVIKVTRLDVQKEEKTFTFYKVYFKKKEFGKNKLIFKMLKFKNGVSLKNGTKIRVLNFFEDVMKNSRDRFNPMWCLVITDFEIVEESMDDTNKEIMDYQSDVNENKESFDFEDLII